MPLPAGEEFGGVIRSQDVRATEKDKVKIGDCFRGGDVVKGLVVCPSVSIETEKFVTAHLRSLSAMLEVTTSQPLEMTWA